MGAVLGNSHNYSNSKGQDQYSDVKEKIVGGLSSSGKISDNYGYVNKVLG